jgi:hypothetical protein
MRVCSTLGRYSRNEPGAGPLASPEDIAHFLKPQAHDLDVLGIMTCFENRILAALLARGHRSGHCSARGRRRYRRLFRRRARRAAIPALFRVEPALPNAMTAKSKSSRKRGLRTGATAKANGEESASCKSPLDISRRNGRSYEAHCGVASSKRYIGDIRSLHWRGVRRPSRYHGKAPDEIDWSPPERQTRAVAGFLGALVDKDPKIASCRR